MGELGPHVALLVDATSTSVRLRLKPLITGAVAICPQSNHARVQYLFGVSSSHRASPFRHRDGNPGALDMHHGIPAWRSVSTLVLTGGM